MSLYLRNIGMTCWGQMVCLWFALAGGAAEIPTIITLRTRARVDAGPVSIGDVTVLQAGNPAQNRRLASIDLDDAPQPTVHRSLRPRHPLRKARNIGLAHVCVHVTTAHTRRILGGCYV